MKLRGNVLLKKLDRYIGIPVLKILSLFHSQKKCPKSVERVAILLTPAIGDTILTQTLLRDIKHFDPFVHITLYLPDNVVETAKLIGNSDEIITLNYSAVVQTIKTIRQKQYDVFIDAGQWTRLSAIFTLFAKAKHTRGFETTGQYRHYGFDEAVHHNDAVHEIINIKNLQWAHYNRDAHYPAIEFKTPSSIDNKRVVIHTKPGGVKSHLKEWDAKNWVCVIQYLCSKGMTVYLTGSKDDTSSLQELIRQCGANNVVNAAGESLTETAELVRNSFLMISVNTGIMHLAAAVGCNLIALHGPTNYLRWGPLNKNSVSIQSTYHSAPCLNLGFEYACKDRTGECMKQISKQAVIGAIDKFLAGQAVN
jgi:ADP-heptose:LPS heptosyltransferase